MHKTSNISELQNYVCLICDEAFFHAVEQPLKCPKCGNDDDNSFEIAEPEEPEEASKSGGLSFS